MLTKILFTIVVIALVLGLSNMGKKSRPRMVESNRSTAPNRRWIKVLAAAVISLMLMGSALFMYLEWQSAHEVLVVSVIDTRSGRTIKYRVARGRLEDRGFQSMDGRYVRLAETERLEIKAGK